MILFWGIAAAAGILMAVQGGINGALGKTIGFLEGNFIVHAIALGVVAVLLFAAGLGKGDLSKLNQTPWYLYSGGIINVAIIYAVMFSVAKAGSGQATTAIISGQLAMAMIIDCFGLFGLEKTSFTWVRGLGLIMMSAAARLILGSAK
jgi:transporter family-2 protein